MESLDHFPHLFQMTTVTMSHTVVSNFKFYLFFFLIFNFKQIPHEGILELV